MCLGAFMSRSMRRVGISAFLMLVVSVAGCSAGADVARDELSVVVQRDGVVFTSEAIPDEVLDQLATNRVIVLGETHHLREHWEFTASLLEKLHARGFRQLLVEQPQMVDWLLDDWAMGGELETGWTAPAHLQNKFSLIRDFNETLPIADRIHVRSIDVNEEHFGGASAFHDLLEMTTQQLPSSGPLGEFLNVGYVFSDPAEQSQSINSLLAALEVDRSTLTTTWGSAWYDTVVELVDVESASIDIRTKRTEDDNSAARAREEVIKQLADARISGYSYGTVINIGGHHAQKSHLKGTEQEWLGDYLVHRSTAIDGTVIVVSVTSAKTELESGSTGTPVDILGTSPEHELLRVIAEAWPAKTVFLPLDDALFSDRTIAVNSEDTIYIASLKDHYDAVLQYGFAHRMSSG